jgi:hypothetical protein
MKPDTLSLAIPLVIITTGVGWLLSSLDVFPAIDWVWTLGLAMIGVLILLAGPDKVTLVAGPLFLLSALLSIPRQMGHLQADVELPMLIIVLGVLLLLVRSSRVASPRWMIDQQHAAPSKDE